MSSEIRVDLGGQAYPIRIGQGVKPGEWLRAEAGRSALIVSDSNVDPLYGHRFQGLLLELGLRTTRCVIPAGESSKCLSMIERVYHEALAAGLERSSFIVALGGGVVGDLAGFAAATYLRGIRLIQVPTSLLAMVDSSVGGKTGINLAEGKNLVGAFWQPVEVCSDLDTLRTLPEREYVSGLAEVVKSAVIRGGSLFDRLERNAAAIMAKNGAAVEDAIVSCCRMKAEVVAADEKETGLRSVLNFGHTLAHALEKVVGYGVLLHGEAVAIGMVFASEVSFKTGRLSASDRDRIRSLVKALKLPSGIGGISGLTWRGLRSSMSSDKKSRSGVPRFVLANAIGSVDFGCEVSESVLEQAYASLVDRD
jgi:3-dehydroquinate synthase